MIKTLFQKVRPYFALAVVLAVFAWSALTILARHAVEYGPDTIVMHIGHFQLEPGARVGIDTIAAEYEEEYAKRWAAGAKNVEGRVWKEIYPDKPRVKILQDAVPESTFYGQWISTQLMGNTAPDIVEVGLGGQGLIRPVWVSYLNRYFIPLTPFVGRPNPHNEGTDLEKVSIRNSYLDGMRGGYVEELQEFYAVPVAQFVVRLFYNEDLLKELTHKMVVDGRLEKEMDRPPLEFHAFIDLCRKIREYSAPNGKTYTPIACSMFHTWMWEHHVCEMVNPQIVRQVDMNHDGLSTPDEFWVAVKCGRVGFDQPQYMARLEMLRDLCESFQTGFVGLQRDDAVFLFAQQKAVFIATGTWDVRGLIEQSKDDYGRPRFKYGLSDFPIPSKDDPKWGKYIEGRRYDNPVTGAVFGVSRTSKYQDVAVDFLLFVASQKGNERFNQYFGWVPAIKGSKPPPDLKGFEPHFDGVQIIDNAVIGGDSWTAWSQATSEYQTNSKMTAAQLVERLEKGFRKDSDKDWIENQMQGRRRGLITTDGILTGMRLRALEAEAVVAKTADAKAKEAAAKQAQSEWIKYRVLSTTQEINQDVLTARQLALYKSTWVPENIGLTTYTSQAVENIRKNAKAAPVAKWAMPSAQPGATP
jgi:ABC-type glycerol-3-phosphate transport system substrate-binding protein